MVFPSADKTSSVPNCAVVFCTSRIGLTSAISSASSFPLSATSSMKHVGLAIIEATLDGCADTWGDRGIARVQIERDVHTGGALGDQRDRLLGHVGDPAPVNIVHREDVHAGVEHLLLLGRVEVADADEDGLGRGDRRRELADLRQLGWLRTEQRRPAPRSRGTPMMWTVRMSGVLHAQVFRRGCAGGAAVRHTVGDPHPAETGPGEMESG